MLSVKFLPNVDSGFYTVDCSETASAFYAPSIQALIAYLRKLGYRSSKMAVLVGAIALGKRKQAHAAAKFIRVISFTQSIADYQRANVRYVAKLLGQLVQFA